MDRNCLRWEFLTVCELSYHSLIHLCILQNDLRTEPQQSTLCQALLGPTLISHDGEHNHLGRETPHLQHNLTVQVQAALPQFVCTHMFQDNTTDCHSNSSS